MQETFNMIFEPIIRVIAFGFLAGTAFWMFVPFLLDVWHGIKQLFEEA